MDKKSIWYFSKKEKIDLIISWLVLSLAFTLVLIKVQFLGSILNNGQAMSLTLAVPIALVAVGTGFVFHELAHRQAARHFGFHSEYRAWYQMLGLAVVIAIVSGWIVAAPGATYFFGQNVTRKQNGLISVAGPAINLVLGFIFLLIGIGLIGSFVGNILIAVSMINFWFAFFNLLPILMLDGSKVLAWNPGVWIVTIGVAGIMAFMPEIFVALIDLAI